MAKVTKSMGVSLYKSKAKKKGSASKSPGPKATPVSKYRGQGKELLFFTFTNSIFRFST